MFGKPLTCIPRKVFVPVDHFCAMVSELRPLIELKVPVAMNWKPVA